MEQFDKFEHYKRPVGPTHEFGTLPQTQPTIKNIGWTLGNDCPYRCIHCYSMNARIKGQNMTIDMIDRVVSQLSINKVETVNLGGNEPLFTNGNKPKDTLLPYIITSLKSNGIEVGLTTSGITLLHLYKDHREAFDLLNDCDISFDSPYEEEHNKNRGAKIFGQAVEALEICQKHNLPHTCIMAAMNWNFTQSHVTDLVLLAQKYDAHVRVNPLKPTQPQHMDIALSPQMYYQGFQTLMKLCDPIDLGEPPLSAKTCNHDAKRCPCGRTSFRIHSITPEGKIPVSPCVYLHDFKTEHDLLIDDLDTIIHSDQFKAFRQRNANPDQIADCADCEHIKTCGGGCTARSYLHTMFEEGRRTLLSKDPYCPRNFPEYNDFPQNPVINPEGEKLVHMDYLCTWIGKPKVQYVI